MTSPILHTFFSDHPSEELLNQLECKCCDCGKSFDSADQLNTHLQLVHLREASLGTIHILRKHFYTWASAGTAVDFF